VALSRRLRVNEYKRLFSSTIRHPTFVNLRIISDLLVIQTGDRIDVVQLRSRRGDDCY
jgi:hypothetical protein